MVADAEQFAEQVCFTVFFDPFLSLTSIYQDEYQRKHVEGVNALSNYLYSLSSQLSDKSGLGGKVSKENKENLQQLISGGTNWVQEYGSTASVEDLEDKLSEIQSVANPIVSELYKGAGQGKSEDTEDDEWYKEEL